MASKRAFAKDVVESDNFIFGLSKIAQLLYFHLGVNADDDGIVGNYKCVLAMCEIGEEYIKELINNGYIIKLADRVVIVSHWNINNTIRKDMYKPTLYQEELKKVKVNSKNYIYEIVTNHVTDNVTNHVTDNVTNHVTDNVTNMLRNTSRNINKYNINKCNVEEHTQVYFTEEQINKLKDKYPRADIEKWIDHMKCYCYEHKKQYRDYYSILCNWINKEPNKFIKESKKDDYYKQLEERS